MALAALALAGCAADYGYYDSYPAYYDGPYYDPYYGSGYGYHSHFHSYSHDFDDDDDRYFRPDDGVVCDRARDVCYDRYGLSYTETKDHFGERDANRAYKKYGDEVFLFSPRKGITCDRRAKTCSKARWTERIFGDTAARPRGLEPRNTRPEREDDDRIADNRLPPAFSKRLDDDDNDGKPRFWKRPGDDGDDGQPRFWKRLDNEDDGQRTVRHLGPPQHDDVDEAAPRPLVRRSVDTGKPRVSSDGGCPPRGCPSK